MLTCKQIYKARMPLCAPLSVTMPITASPSASLMGWSVGFSFSGSNTRREPTLPLVICGQGGQVPQSKALPCV